MRYRLLKRVLCNFIHLIWHRICKKKINAALAELVRSGITCIRLLRDLQQWEALKKDPLFLELALNSIVLIELSRHYFANGASFA